MSSGVPNTVTVETNDIRPPTVSSTSGTAMLLVSDASLLDAASCAMIALLCL